jgi:hypothetical protein
MALQQGYSNLGKNVPLSCSLTANQSAQPYALAGRKFSSSAVIAAMLSGGNALRKVFRFVKDVLDAENGAAPPEFLYRVPV